MAFLEAAVNEFFQDVEDMHSVYVVGLRPEQRAQLSKYWKKAANGAPVLTKYQQALHFGGKLELDPGDELYFRARLLIRLRNLLVHFVPESASGDTKQPIEQLLETRFEPNRLMAGTGNPYFPDKCLGAGCSAWAVQSAIEFAGEVFRRLGLDPNYLLVGWDEAGNPRQLKA